MGVLDPGCYRRIRIRMNTEITIFPEAIEAIVNNPFGSIALECSRVADDILVKDAKETLSIPRFGHYPNPAPGPPRRRTGDLVASIRSDRPVVDNRGLVVYVVSDPSAASHRHYDPNYSQWLRTRGYKFLSFELPETFH